MSDETINLWIHGLSGRMGQVLMSQVVQLNDQWRFIGGTSVNDFETKKSKLLEAHVIIDFSSVAGNLVLLNFLEQQDVVVNHVVVCTTGLEKKVLDRWQKLAIESKGNVLIAPNTSLGIALSLKGALSVSSTLLTNNFDLEIEETHHKHKQDLPSGTAYYLADHLAKKHELHITTHRSNARQANELGLHASRGGGVFGEHRIRFLGEHEEVTITHRAYSRELFAKGALYLGRWLFCQDKSKCYGLSDVYEFF